MVYRSYAFSSKGGREENQDSIAVHEQNGSGIYVVADGLGGLQNGKDASELTVKTSEILWKPKTSKDPEVWLRELFERANQELVQYSQVNQVKVRTTLVVLRLDGTHATWAHTGDSRLYYLHNGKITRLTEDHSVAYKKYKAGEITRSEIAQDVDQSTLLRTLGGNDRWEPDVDACTVEPGDAFLLCSDGFWEYVRDDEILLDLLKASSARDWAEQMLVRLMARIEENNDNLSVITVMVE